MTPMVRRVESEFLLYKEQHFVCMYYIYIYATKVHYEHFLFYSQHMLRKGLEVKGFIIFNLKLSFK